MAYLSLHGSADKVIPPAGGTLPVTEKEGFRLHSVTESTQLFARLNGCDATPALSSVDARLESGPTTADVTTYSCSAATPVQAYMVQGENSQESAYSDVAEYVVGTENTDSSFNFTGGGGGLFHDWDCQ